MSTTTVSPQSAADGVRPLLVAPAVAGHYLGISRTKIYELMAAGALRSVKIGKARRIPVSELERFISEQLGEVAADD